MDTLSRRLSKFHGLLYISPWLIGFLLVTAYPFFSAIFYSFTNFDLFALKFVGLRNYARIFTRDPLFLKSLSATLRYSGMAVPGKLIMALILALLLNRTKLLTGFYRTVFYLPSILGGSVALSILWRFLFRPDGLVNSLLAVVGIGAINWLGDPRIALYSIVLLPLWQLGAPMVLFLAGLKAIPSSLYESASMDGARRVRVFFSITLPMLSPIILFNLVMQTIVLLQLFTPAFVTTQGGPAHATYLYSLMLYDTAFRDFKMGYASALSWVLFSVILVFTFVLFRSSRYWTYYDE
jgi:oligogalacturonide transport system permease protein